MQIGLCREKTQIQTRLQLALSRENTQLQKRGWKMAWKKQNQIIIENNKEKK